MLLVANAAVGHVVLQLMEGQALLRVVDTYFQNAPIDILRAQQRASVKEMLATEELIVLLLISAELGTLRRERCGQAISLGIKPCIGKDTDESVPLERQCRPCLRPQAPLERVERDFEYSCGRNLRR